MAGVLVELGVAIHRQLPGPRLGVEFGIVDCKGIVQLLIFDSREALGEVNAFRDQSLFLHLPRIEVFSLNHKRVAFVIADGIPQPFIVGQIFKLLVDAYDACIVHHLGEQHHMRRRLHNLHIIIVKTAQKRRGRRETNETAIR